MTKFEVCCSYIDIKRRKVERRLFLVSFQVNDTLVWIYQVSSRVIVFVSKHVLLHCYDHI